MPSVPSCTIWWGQLNTRSCLTLILLTLILARIIYWQAREIGHKGKRLACKNHTHLPGSLTIGSIEHATDRTTSESDSAQEVLASKAPPI
jgi:hypothetical protein